MSMELQIYRPLWLNGEGASNSKLLRSSDGKMCCLGQLSVACRIPKSSIRDIGNLGGLPEELKRMLPIYLQPVYKADQPYISSDSIVRITDANDSHGVTQEEREAKLTLYFERAGINVKFVDEMPEYLKEAI